MVGVALVRVTVKPAPSPDIAEVVASATLELLIIVRAVAPESAISSKLPFRVAAPLVNCTDPKLSSVTKWLLLKLGISSIHSADPSEDE